MAKQTIQQLVDDLDGGVLEPGEGETVLFSLDGIAYEIDLSTKNAAALRDTVGLYTGAGRRVVAARLTRGAAPQGRSRRTSNENSTIREWALAHGHTLASRGRIPEDIQAAYRAAH